jgi:hypothetical protein
MKKTCTLGLHIFVFVSVFIAFGCGSPTYTPSSTLQNVYSAKYDIALVQVGKPSGAKEQYGQHRIEKLGKEEEHDYLVEDRMIRILWFVTPLDIDFLLENKATESIKILWDEALFVDENEKTHSIIHSGVKYPDRDKPQPPTVIPENGKIREVIYPADYLYYRKADYSRYSSTPCGAEKKALLPCGLFGGDPRVLREKVDTCVGKKIGVVLPLQIGDAVYEYVFTFRVNSVKVELESR